jgi:hypothetical protein
VNFGRSARAYAERGFHVFPLQPGTKEPFEFTHGEKDATTDAKTIDQWARRWPNANIAIVPGNSGLFVVDVDVRAFGHESLATLPTLPDTATVCTGGGGWHYYFKRPESLDGRKCKTLHIDGLKVSGLDVKGVCAGYLVAPPSIHPSGRPYLWEASSRVDEIPIADAPAWLVQLVRESGRRAIEHTPHAVPVEASTFYLGVAFAEAGLLGRELRNGVFAVTCPNQSAHTNGESGSESSTVIFAPQEPGARGSFFCSHTSGCAEFFR